MEPETITYLTSKPAYPWSEGIVGMLALAAVGLLLIGLTLWTYLGHAQATPRRLTYLIALRLLALLIVLLTLLRPSLAIEEDPRLPSVLAIAVDKSESMTVQDEYNNQTRWEAVQNVLRRCEPLFPELEEAQNIRVELYQFAGEGFDPAKSRYDPETQPDGERTDFGTMLGQLAAKYEAEPDAKRGLVILSDGADNGVRMPALAVAERWNGIAPIRPFALGQTTTSSDVRDIAVTTITPTPSPVAIKGKVTVRAQVNAPGYEGATVKAQLLFDDQLVKTVPVKLYQKMDNEIRLEADAPSEAGEIKVTLRLMPQFGEVTELNNQIETYLTVTKEGLSVLVIDSLRLELKYLRQALASEKRIRYYEAIRQTNDVPSGGIENLYGFDQRFYDVIILADVSAEQLAAGNPALLRKIAQLVRNDGVGLLMMGGLKSFGGTSGVAGSGDWRGTPVGELLPVRLNVTGQVDEPTAMQPTQKGLENYLLRLSTDPQENQDIWNRLNDPLNRTLLNGRNRLGEVKLDATVLARVGDPLRGDPLLVSRRVGKGRVLAFAADSTWQWTRLGIPTRLGEPVRTEGFDLHRRFWKQVVLWLAQQEEVEGNAFIRPEFRRLPVRGRQELRMGLRGKTGNRIENATFRYRIVPPQGAAPEPRAPDRDANNQPRVRYEPLLAGEYQVTVEARGIDRDGSEVVDEATARFLVYPDISAEMMQPAANHELLGRLEAVTDPGRINGPVARAEDLPDFLRKLKEEPLPRSRTRPRYTPDWRRDVDPWFLPAVLLAFVGVLVTEWGLRRFWGMV